MGRVTIIFIKIFVFYINLLHSQIIMGASASKKTIALVSKTNETTLAPVSSDELASRKHSAAVTELLSELDQQIENAEQLENKIVRVRRQTLTLKTSGDSDLKKSVELEEKLELLRRVRRKTADKILIQMEALLAVKDRSSAETQ